MTSPPPTPENATSWPEFTAALRALYEWCGSPKYRTLCARAPGLSPSAVSTLIGRSSLSRPPETTTARFAEACLRHAAWPTPEEERTRWTAHWHHLSHTESHTTGPSQTTGSSRTTESGPEHPAEHSTEPKGTTADREAHRDRHTPAAGHVREHRPTAGEERPGPVRRVAECGPAYVVIGVAIILAALTGGVFAFVLAPQEAGSDPATGCRYLRGTIQDARADRVWSHLFQCPNQAGTGVYAQAGTGRRIGILETDPSWFICWVRGERHEGGNDVWYYTQGDRATRRPELDAWGYVPASALLIPRHPDPAVTRECPVLNGS